MSLVGHNDLLVRQWVERCVWNGARLGPADKFSVIFTLRAAWFVNAPSKKSRLLIKLMTTKKNSELQLPKQKVIRKPLLVKTCPPN